MPYWNHLLAAVMLTATVSCPPTRAQDRPAIGQTTLVAEAGSIGGSIGKKDKSISDDGEQRSSPPAARSSRPANRNADREGSFPKTIQLNEHAFGQNWTVTLQNVGGNNYRGTWSHGYVTKFAVTAFTQSSMKMQRTDNPAVGAVTGSYTGSRTGNSAAGQAAISNGFTSKWDASW